MSAVTPYFDPRSTGEECDVTGCGHALVDFMVAANPNIWWYFMCRHHALGSADPLHREAVR